MPLRACRDGWDWSFLGLGFGGGGTIRVEQCHVEALVTADRVFDAYDIEIVRAD